MPGLPGHIVTRVGNLAIDGYQYRIMRTPGGYDPSVVDIRRFGLSHEDLDLLSDMQGAVEELVDMLHPRVCVVTDRVTLERWWDQLTEDLT